MYYYFVHYFVLFFKILNIIEEFFLSEHILATLKKIPC